MKCVCIKKTWQGGDIVNVGTVMEFEHCPNRSWREFQGQNPIQALRAKLDEMKVTWGDDWPIEKLELEAGREEYWRFQKEARERHKYTIFGPESTTQTQVNRK
jgi:hypothetical protein